MVKGISRQVIVVHSPDPKLFDQAIFILKDEAVGKEGVTDDILLREAKRLINMPASRRSRKPYMAGLIWALGGAVAMGIVWLATVVL